MITIRGRLITAYAIGAVIGGIAALGGTYLGGFGVAPWKAGILGFLLGVFGLLVVVLMDDFSEAKSP